MDKLYKIASQFRRAIEKAVKNGELKEMKSFPNGCCGLASDLLQRYLIKEYSIFTWYISGEYGYGWDGESHTWLETQDGIVVDITGDQYKYKKTLHFEEAVYVGTRKNGFHEKFKLSEPVAYSEVIDPIDQNNKFDTRYKTVLKYLDN